MGNYMHLLVSFAKMRRDFSTEVFKPLKMTLLELARPLIDTHRWHGWRVVATDGSCLRVSTRRGAGLDATRYFYFYCVTKHA